MSAALDLLTKCTDKKKHLLIASVGFAVAATVAGMSFGVIGKYDAEDDSKNRTSRNIASFLLVGAALALGWNMKGGLESFLTGDASGKSVSAVKIALAVAILLVVWIGKGQIDDAKNPTAMMATAGGLSTVIALAAIVKIYSCTKTN